MSILLLTLSVAAVVFSPLRADAQSTYTTTNGTVNLVAGLTNLSSATAINTTNQATGISYITDSSWSTTGILNLGGSAGGSPIAGGTLAGTFGGGTCFAASNSIILIGGYGGGTNVAWGGWTVRLLLSDDNYSLAISCTDWDLALNPAVDINPSWYQNSPGNLEPLGSLPTLYQQLEIAAFDTGNIGVKGLELSNFQFTYPDITYIGVADAVPEPSTYALLALSAAGLGG